jgi:hypothetical protein
MAPMSRGGLLAVLTSAVVLAALAPLSLAAPRTTAPGVLVNVHVTISDTTIKLTPKTAPRGSDARFLIRNIGKKPHTFTLGAAKVRPGSPTGFTRAFPPKSHQIFVLLLTYRGTLPYSVDGGRSGMKGVFTIGETCALCIPD